MRGGEDENATVELDGVSALAGTAGILKSTDRGGVVLDVFSCFDRFESPSSSWSFRLRFTVEDGVMGGSVFREDSG